MRTITVSTTGICKAAPDTVSVSLELSALDKDYSTATALAAKQLKLLQTALQPIGFGESDIKTSHFSVDPRYEYENNKRVFNGYNVQQGLTISLPMVSERLAAVLGAVAKSGSDPEVNLCFRVEDTTPLTDKALSIAVAEAFRRARLLADACGCTLGELQSLSHSSASSVDFSLNFRAKAVFATAESALDIQPDDVAVNETVNAVFEIL